MEIKEQVQVEEKTKERSQRETQASNVIIQGAKRKVKTPKRARKESL